MRTFKDTYSLCLLLAREFYLIHLLFKTYIFCFSGICTLLILFSKTVSESFYIKYNKSLLLYSLGYSLLVINNTCVKFIAYKLI